MSRKERPGAGPFGAAPVHGPAAAPLVGGTPASLFAAAVAQHQAGAFAEAERRYRYILSTNPDHADSLHNLGLLALQSGNAASAAELIGKAIKAQQPGRRISLQHRAGLALRPTAWIR